MAQATPTPWYAELGEHADTIRAVARSRPIALTSSYAAGNGPARAERQANALLIVRAVNAHEPLVDALSDARERMLGGGAHIARLRDKADAALALASAEGGQ